MPIQIFKIQFNTIKTRFALKNRPWAMPFWKNLYGGVWHTAYSLARKQHLSLYPSTQCEELISHRAYFFREFIYPRGRDISARYKKICSSPFDKWSFIFILTVLGKLLATYVIRTFLENTMVHSAIAIWNLTERCARKCFPHICGFDVFIWQSKFYFSCRSTTILLAAQLKVRNQTVKPLHYIIFFSGSRKFNLSTTDIREIKSDSENLDDSDRSSLWHFRAIFF